MSEPQLDLLELLVTAAVSIGATVEAAAHELSTSGVGAIAVLDGAQVKGMFTEDDLLRAVFPGYLGELRHTSFVERDNLLGPHLQQAATTLVSQFMRKPELVALPASAVDVAQRFLHTEATALVATRLGAFAGVIDQAQFCTAILRRYGWQL